MEKKTNKAKWTIFKFLRISALSNFWENQFYHKAIAFDKKIMPYLQILQKYAY